MHVFSHFRSPPNRIRYWYSINYILAVLHHSQQCRHFSKSWNVLIQLFYTIQKGLYANWDLATLILLPLAHVQLHNSNVCLRGWKRKCNNTGSLALVVMSCTWCLLHHRCHESITVSVVQATWSCTLGPSPPMRTRARCILDDNTVHLKHSSLLH